MWEFFQSAKEVAQTGVNWGVSKGAAILEKGGQLKDAAVDAATSAAHAAKKATIDAAIAAKDAAVQTAQKAKDALVQGANTAKNAALDAAAATKKAATDAAHYVGAKVDAGIGAATQGLKNVEGAVASGIAKYGTKAAVANTGVLNSLQGGLDRRADFTAATCAECADKAAGKHPDASDGKFMGKDCQPSATKPAEGKKPTCHNEGKNVTNKQFPQITLTNGINNTPAQVCQTMQLLADSRCAEVFAIYNATYANKETIVAPTGSNWSTFKDGLKNLDPKQVVDGALKGLLNPAAKSGMVADVVDCIDTIKGGRDEAASKLLRDEIVKSLSGDNPKAMTIYAHSQGGLNAQAALDLASAQLLDQEQGKFLKQGMSQSAAMAAADASVLEKLKKLDVSTFGTVEKGFVDGPTYTRYTNDYDPVPKIIREAQRGLAPSQLARDPVGSPGVDEFSAAPSFDPMAAHGMNETYIPRMNEKKAMGQCC
jgi:hypothetical protein